MRNKIVFTVIVFLFCSSFIIDITAQWINTGVNYGTIRTIALKNESIYAGTTSGVYLSDNMGLTWIALNNSPITNTTEVTSIAFKGTYIFIATWGPGVFRSTDNGLNWTNVTNNMLQGGLYSIITCSDGSILTGTVGNGIFRSEDNGASWTSVANFSPTWSMTINNTIIYAGTTNFGIQRSTTNGVSWESFNDGLPAGAIIRSVATIGNKVLAGTLVHGAYYLENNVWQQINNGLPDDGLGQYHAVLAFTGNDNAIFAGTTGGVYMSSDNGSSWQSINDGLSETNIRALAITDLILFTGTSSGGIWYRPLSEFITSIDGMSEYIPNGYEFNQNYPNPFNPYTTISFTIPKEEYVSLKVFNSIGEEIAELVNETRPAGNYKTDFNGTGLPSGIYFYKLQTGSFTQTKKMTVLK